MRRGRNGAYYACELNRRQCSLVPEDHQCAVYLREDKAGEKVVEFLTTRVFGPERVEALRASLAEIGPEADNVHAELDRLRSDLDGIKKRIRRLVTNLEAQEPSSEIADDIRSRLEELGTLRAKKQQALEAAEKERTRWSIYVCVYGSGCSSHRRVARNGRSWCVSRSHPVGAVGASLLSGVRYGAGVRVLVFGCPASDRGKGGVVRRACPRGGAPDVRRSR
jgi:hypothetical protein